MASLATQCAPASRLEAHIKTKNPLLTQCALASPSSATTQLHQAVVRNIPQSEVEVFQIWKYQTFRPVGRSDHRLQQDLQLDEVGWGLIGESLQQNQRCDSMAWGERIFVVGWGLTV